MARPDRLSRRAAGPYSALAAAGRSRPRVRPPSVSASAMPVPETPAEDRPDDDLLAALHEEGLTRESAHVRWMRLALEEAKRAADEDEVPVGAVVVAAGRIVASAHKIGRAHV